MKKFFEITKQIIGAGSFVAIIYFKVTGGAVDVLWLAIPALLMGVKISELKELFESIAKALLKK